MILVDSYGRELIRSRHLKVLQEASALVSYKTTIAIAYSTFYIAVSFQPSRVFDCSAAVKYSESATFKKKDVNFNLFAIVCCQTKRMPSILK